MTDTIPEWELKVFAIHFKMVFFYFGQCFLRPSFVFWSMLSGHCQDEQKLFNEQDRPPSDVPQDLKLQNSKFSE